MPRTALLLMFAALSLPATAAAGQPPPGTSPPPPQPASAAPATLPAPAPSAQPYPPQPQPYPPYPYSYPPYAQPYPPNGQPYPPNSPYAHPYPSPYPPPPPPPLSMAPEEMPPDDPGRYEAEKKSRFHNPAMFGFGIALTALGGASFLAGVASIFVLAQAGSGDDAYIGSVVAITGGAVVTGIGVPMIVIGGRRRGPDSSSAPGSHAPAWIGAPHGVAWAWAF